jgi:hypothetical protein
MGAGWWAEAGFCGIARFRILTQMRPQDETSAVGIRDILRIVFFLSFGFFQYSSVRPLT